MPAIKAGTIRPLANTSKNRWPDLPDVPTTVELGYPTVNLVQFSGLSGPPKVPSDIIGIWNEGLQEMLKDPEVLSKLKNLGQEPFYLNTREFRDYVTKETEELKELYGLK